MGPRAGPVLERAFGFRCSQVPMIFVTGIFLTFKTEDSKGRDSNGNCLMCLEWVTTLPTAPLYREFSIFWSRNGIDPATFNPIVQNFVDTRLAMSRCGAGRERERTPRPGSRPIR